MRRLQIFEGAYTLCTESYSRPGYVDALSTYLDVATQCINLDETVAEKMVAIGSNLI